ncbi:MAG: prepilin-type N-terminal cleavage/methylation domain-containing protein [Thermoleophilia bacterium]|nr:prepilin-type N-terminal cleavage/methylation domain-containing protein [Thermoleophilia bacterium]
MSAQRHRLLRLRGRLARSAGFTMTELLVAMLIMMVVLAAIYAIWFGLQRTYAFTDEDLTAQHEARAALSEMVELIRTSRQPDSSTVPEALRGLVIVQAAPNRLVCYTDVDRDENHQLELVQFRVDTVERTLYRDTDVSHTNDVTFSSADSTRLVGRWLSNTEDDEENLFDYKGMYGTALTTTTGTNPMTGEAEVRVADPSQIREITIKLMIDVIKDKAPIRHELTSVVQPRNLR